MDDHAWTPLHTAAQAGELAAVDELIAGDADVNATIRDSMHDSDPASWAEFSRRPEIAQTIRVMEAISVRDWDRLKPLLHPYLHFDGLRGRKQARAPRPGHRHQVAGHRRAARRPGLPLAVQRGLKSPGASSIGVPCGVRSAARSQASW
jgi:hypothetical protein